MPAIAPVVGTLPISSRRYRQPGIEREGIAQLSLLETALWPLSGGPLAEGRFETSYTYATAAGPKTASVTVRSTSGLQPMDELVLWGLLAATLTRPDAEPTLVATPRWMLRRLGLDVGGSQYAQLRDALLRLAVTTYQNDGFYNPHSREREVAAFHFLSVLLPTIDGMGENVDNARCWRIEWNPMFFRFCRHTGGNLLFDLDLFRVLSPAGRRLFLKLKDRFWRAKRVFINVDELTIHGLGFSAERPLAKRKFDLLQCLRELIDHGVLALGPGESDASDLIVKHGKGSYVVVCHEGEYFRQTMPTRVSSRKNAISEDPLFEPLQKVGIDGPAIVRLLRSHSRGLIQRWVRITDAAQNEQPRGFPGFKVSPAAFLIDGIQNQRTPPDWMAAHEKRMEQRLWKQRKAEALAASEECRPQYDAKRNAAMQEFLASPTGRKLFKDIYPMLLELHRVNDPHRCHKTAHDATLQRIERMHFAFPDYETWLARRPAKTPAS